MSDTKNGDDRIYPLAIVQ